MSINRAGTPGRRSRTLSGRNRSLPTTGRQRYTPGSATSPGWGKKSVSLFSIVISPKNKPYNVIRLFEKRNIIVKGKKENGRLMVHILAMISLKFHDRFGKISDHDSLFEHIIT
jgi:hypothetical protein